ncbi:MurR/RpiR family transcriptional regulator [Anaerobranca gottschalkii]|uniref:Transcriptional regulator, RpiR family n=1 Tax=Anaerobranca gottschalkii DSM 13577 TaxID=1120990 RepID=A0A1I0CBD6_9FIRM|nr:MurR/RpiR family transcriptional regulator [Anaerobranca gottschalkii]SET16822.1 transcriptional regulator, RpiR family [Anaerobranca gottschalkii DSM 13577]
MGKLINKFSNYIPSLSYAEKHVFYYIDQNFEKAKKQSLTKIATENNVSTTTVIRMCIKLGLSGFSELKYILKSLDYNESKTKYNSVDAVKTNIESTLTNLNYQNLKILIRHIISSKKIVIVSVGLSKPIGEYFAKLLIQANKNTIYIYESHIIDLIPGMVDYNDLIIFISNSGETKTLVTVAEKLNYQNFKTAAIINSVDSSLSKLVNISICGLSNKIEYKGYDISSRSILLVLIDILFLMYIEEKKSNRTIR